MQLKWLYCFVFPTNKVTRGTFLSYHVFITSPAHWNLSGSTTNLSAAWVTARQYSSATLATWKDVERSKLLFRFFYVFKNCVRMKLRDLKLRKSGSVGRRAIRPLQTHCIIRRQQPNQTRNYSSCIIWAKRRVTNVKEGGTHNQGQIKKRASRAAARGANLYGAHRRHWSNRKYCVG